MTFLTNPSLIVKKAPLIEGKCDEEVIDVGGEGPWAGEPRMTLGALICMTLATLVVTLLGVATGFLLYRQYVRVGTHPPRYQGYCTIPIKDPAYYMPNYRVMPLRWSSEPEVQVFSAADDSNDDVARALQEELDIGDTVEKISVVDNGRHVNFIHDFEANVTGIVDAERCFFMDLDPETVLSPEVFVLSIEGGSEFDVSHVRSTLRAAIPALQQLAFAARDLAEKCADRPTYKLTKEEGVVSRDGAFSPIALAIVAILALQQPVFAARDLAEKCADRPTYKLTKEEGVVIRKRSVDAPPHDYIQFAGRHVQEILISNLADLLQHEQAARE